MAPLRTTKSSDSLVSENGTAAGDSHQSPSLSPLPEVTVDSIAADNNSPNSLSGVTQSPSEAAWRSEFDTLPDHRTTAFIRHPSPEGGPSLLSRGLDVEGLSPAGLGALAAFGGLAVTCIGVYVVSEVMHGRSDRASDRAASAERRAESQADVTQAPKRSVIKDAVTRLCPTNRPKSALPTESGSQQHPQPIELNDMPQPLPCGPYAKLG